MFIVIDSTREETVNGVHRERGRLPEVAAAGPAGHRRRGRARTWSRWGSSSTGPTSTSAAARPERTRKFLNVKAGQAKVALVVDDLVSTDPSTSPVPAGLRHGRADRAARPVRFRPVPADHPGDLVELEPRRPPVRQRRVPVRSAPDRAPARPARQASGTAAAARAAAGRAGHPAGDGDPQRGPQPDAVPSSPPSSAPSGAGAVVDRPGTRPSTRARSVSGITTAVIAAMADVEHHDPEPAGELRTRTAWQHQPCGARATRAAPARAAR